MIKPQHNKTRKSPRLPDFPLVELQYLCLHRKSCYKSISDGGIGCFVPYNHARNDSWPTEPPHRCMMEYFSAIPCNRRSPKKRFALQATAVTPMQRAKQLKDQIWCGFYVTKTVTNRDRTGQLQPYFIVTRLTMYGLPQDVPNHRQLPNERLPSSNRKLLPQIRYCIELCDIRVEHEIVRHMDSAPQTNDKRTKARLNH
jgi:hypothetical protein